MKKIKYLAFFFVMLISFASSISATTKGYITSSSGLYVRTSPEVTSTNRALLLSPGINFIINYKTLSQSSCSGYWYHITYFGGDGYVCGNYIYSYDLTQTISGVDSFQTTLQTFPVSYHPYLISLHNMYPNASFVAKNTNLEWSNVIDMETNSLGLSLIQTTFDGWKNIETYNATTGIYNTNFVGGGTSWFAASRDIISYYMDPRNFLNRDFIFMFESSAYNPAIHTRQGLQSLITGSFMDGNIADGMTYADAIIQAASVSGISPYVLAARIKQEVGSTGNGIISGTVNGTTYYNYYNIGAYGSTSEQTIANGLNYAANKGWNSRLNAIIGGANFIAENYSGSQYSQKWDVLEAPLYVNQYMQNIQAPASETIKVYDSYDASGSLQSAFTFEIPVFNNMPATASEVPSSKTQINYLTDITVNNSKISGFVYYLHDYTVYVSSESTSVTLGATVKDSSSTVSGLGPIALTNTTTEAKIKVTSAGGSVREYTVNVIKSSDIPLSASEIVSQIGVKYDGTYISGITTDVTIGSIKNKIASLSSSAVVNVTNKNGVEKTSALVTGDKVVITIGSTVTSNDIVIYGDVNGDGGTTILDLLIVQKKLLKSLSLDGAYYKAGDVDKDGDVTIRDLLIVQKYLLGKLSIDQ